MLKFQASTTQSWSSSEWASWRSSGWSGRWADQQDDFDWPHLPSTSSASKAAPVAPPALQKAASVPPALALQKATAKPASAPQAAARPATPPARLSVPKAATSEALQKAVQEWVETASKLPSPRKDNTQQSEPSALQKADQPEALAPAQHKKEATVSSTASETLVYGVSARVSVSPSRSQSLSPRAKKSKLEDEAFSLTFITRVMFFLPCKRHKTCLNKLIVHDVYVKIYVF